MTIIYKIISKRNKSIIKIKSSQIFGYSLPPWGGEGGGIP